MTDTTGVYWPEKFQSTKIGDLDMGLQQILVMQAQRVDELMKRESELVEKLDKLDEEDKNARALLKERDKLGERIDRNLDKVYRNAMTFRLAKAPRPTAARGRTIDPDGNSLPDQPTPQMMAAAFEELEAAGFKRDTLTFDNVRTYLRDQGRIALPSPDDEDVI